MPLFGIFPEVIEAYAPPFAGIVEMLLQAFVHLTIALFIHHRLQLMPCLNECLHLLHSAVVMILHLLPKGAAALHAIVPCHVVEPQQILIGTGGEVVILSAEGLAILADGIGALGRAVETYARTVCLMVIHGLPFLGEVGLVASRLRTVVVVCHKDMMQTEGHHVIHTCLMAAEHDVEGGGEEFFF